jgi:drug/metabolite transporter (DMT)-like permease
MRRSWRVTRSPAAGVIASDIRPRALDVTAIALMVLLCAIWGFTQVTIKLANTGFSPLFQAGLRSAGAALLLWAWSALRGVPLWGRDGSLGHGVVITTLFAAEFVLIYQGLALTTAARAVLFVYTAPFVVAVGAHFLVPGERLRGLKIAGLACAFLGITVAVADALRLPTRAELNGDLLVLGGAVCWGATTVAIKASRHVHLTPNKRLFYQLGGSAVILLPLSVATGERGLVAPSPGALSALAFQIVVVAFASYLAWFWLLARYPASELSAFTFLTPLFGMAAGGLVLGERIGPALAVAMALVALGLYLVNR